MTDTAKQSERLSKPMQKALNWLKQRPAWHKNWCIPNASLLTLEALYRRGLVDRQGTSKWSFEYRAALKEDQS